jgi:hypothetical protein
VDVGKLATTTPAPAFPPNQIQNRATCEFDFRPLGDGTIKAERFNQSWMIDRSEVERIKAL